MGRSSASISPRSVRGVGTWYCDGGTGDVVGGGGVGIRRAVEEGAVEPLRAALLVHRARLQAGWEVADLQAALTVAMEAEKRAALPDFGTLAALSPPEVNDSLHVSCRRRIPSNLATFKTVDRRLIAP